MDAASFRNAGAIPQPLRDDLITYLFCTSSERAGIISTLVERNPGVADLLMDLEADDDLRAKVEISLLQGRGCNP